MAREELTEAKIRQIIKTSKNPELVAFKSVLKTSTDSLSNLLFSNREVIDAVATIYAKQNNLCNGATIHYLNDDYRNNNLLFWDAQNQKIVYPFYEIDDYGSVPPIFVVGDGYFNPKDWLDEVDHNSIVFPSISLINEMKEFASKNPVTNKMTVKINGEEYEVGYDKTFTLKDWDSCFIEVDLNYLSVSKGLPEWREDIVVEED
jgi:hypothetical protein